MKKYFIERKYLNVAIFFVAAGAVTAGFFLVPTDTPIETDRLAQCKRAMGGGDSERMKLEKERCLKEFEELLDGL